MPERPVKAGLAGSPSTGEPVYLAVGYLRRPHGVHGDLLMELQTDFPERLRPGVRVYVGEQHAPLTITRVRNHNDGLLLGFRGVGSPQEAGRYRNAVVSVPAADRPSLPEGKYYYHQLIGLKVKADTGETLGVLTEIMSTGANDVYVVTDGAGRELLLPAIESVILEMDLRAGFMKVHLIPGLLESQATA